MRNIWWLHGYRWGRTDRLRMDLTMKTYETFQQAKAHEAEVAALRQEIRQLNNQLATREVVINTANDRIWELSEHRQLLADHCWGLVATRHYAWMLRIPLVGMLVALAPAWWCLSSWQKHGFGIWPAVALGLVLVCLLPVVYCVRRFEFEPNTFHFPDGEEMAVSQAKVDEVKSRVGRALRSA
jgi:hypothetical protein